MSSIRRSDSYRLAAALLAVAVVTMLLRHWLQITTVATVSTTYLMVVLLVAATSRLWVAVATSIAAMLCLNFFFLPPVGKFTIADPQNWVALFAFLAVSLVASNLSAVARARTRGSRRPARRAGAPVRLEPRRADDDGQRRGALGSGAVDRAPIRSGVRRHRGAAGGRVGCAFSRTAPCSSTDVS